MKAGGTGMKEYIMEVAETGMVVKVKDKVVRCKDCEFFSPFKHNKGK